MYSLTLTREQELALIEIGLRVVLEQVQTNVKPVAKVALPLRDPVSHRRKPKQRRTKAKRRWSPEQRAKFKATMKKLWAERKAG